MFCQKDFTCPCTQPPKEVHINSGCFALNILHSFSPLQFTSILHWFPLIPMGNIFSSLSVCSFIHLGFSFIDEDGKDYQDTSHHCECMRFIITAWYLDMDTYILLSTATQIFFLKSGIFNTLFPFTFDSKVILKSHILCNYAAKKNCGRNY